VGNRIGRDREKLGTGPKERQTVVHAKKPNDLKKTERKQASHGDTKPQTQTRQALGLQQKYNEGHIPRQKTEKKKKKKKRTSQRTHTWTEPKI